MTALMDLKVAWDAFVFHKRKHWGVAWIPKDTLTIANEEAEESEWNCGKRRERCRGMFAIFRMEGPRRSRACSNRATRISVDPGAGRI